ncbi:MAG: hypothetical protein A2V66_11685 [Ignavibacteria bacterium RBG_13_36_8]|nr:MAG: hypothetical protein A2V66_11685 [Ignavibacteria bacterium RBG_13_36_8]
MKKSLFDPVVKFFISAVGLVIIFTVLKELQHIFIPFVIAYFLYFIFEPFNFFLQSKKVPSFLTTIINLLVVIIVIWGISRVILSSFSRLGEELPLYEQKFNGLISGTAQSMGSTNPSLVNFNISAILNDLDYGGIVGGFFSSTLSIFSTLFFVLFFFIFISSGHTRFLEAIKKRYVERNIKTTIKKIKKELKQEGASKKKIVLTEKLIEEIKKQRGVKIEKTFKDITKQVQRYISTKFLISLSIGLVVGIILWLFGVKFFIVWAVLSILLNFIPNIGSVFSVMLPSLMALIQFESFGYALLIAAIIIVFQNIIGNIVEPKIFGDRLGLNPIVILLSLLLWGYIWGIVGMFLSVPLTAVLKIIISSSTSNNMKFIGELMGN